MKLVSTRLMGGLGNLLFQIATAYSVSLRDNKILICDTSDMMVPHKPYTFYLSNIFRKVKFSDNMTDLNYIGEQGFHYSPIPSLQGNVKLVGYFQSEKYFINHREQILNLFDIDEETKSNLTIKFGEFLSKETCSIHVRRGDYLGLQNHHPVQSIDYYQESVKIIGEDKHFMVFSDDIKWCEENLVFLKNKTFISGNFDYEDLYLMSMCKHNIIANSSFSWWGAWLNQNPNKKVIAPKIWFGNFYSSFNTNDLYFQDNIIL
jgi:hypothetical protein